MTLESEISEQISSYLSDESLSGKTHGNYLSIIIRTNLGLNAIENLMRNILESKGVEISSVERIWSGASSMGAIVFRINCGCNLKSIVIIYYLCDRNILVAMKETICDPLTDLYDDINASVSSSVLRIYTEKFD